MLFQLGLAQIKKQEEAGHIDSQSLCEAIAQETVEGHHMEEFLFKGNSSTCEKELRNLLREWAHVFVNLEFLTT